jgi:signal transduction histidine kinase
LKPDPLPPVVVFAPIPSDAATLRQVVAEERLEAYCCADEDDFYAAIGRFPLLALVTEEGLARCAVEALSGILHRQPSWSDVPMLVLAEAEGRRIDSNRFIRLAEIGNVVLLTRPTSRSTLAMALRSAVRTRKLQFSVRDQLAELAGNAEKLESLVAERTRELELEVAERRRVEHTLAEARRLESLGQLTGGIAHDFNNILQVVTGSETLLRLLLGGAADPRALRTLDSIRRAADHGASLTQQLLAYARRQPLASIVLDLRKHLQTISEMILHMLGPEVQLRLQVSSPLWPVLIDPSQLDAALLNIASNARDAMPPDGKLVISARNRVLPDPALPEGAHLAGEFVELCLSDNGHGMSSDTAENAFEPFFTTKEVGKGTGLGLSQVYGFAIQSKGLAYIRREAVGTSVGILLPRSQAAPKADPLAGALNAKGIAGLRILYVEDDPDVAEVTTTMLQSLGASVTVVDSADAAVAADLSGIDAVLSDVMMPGEMDGIDLSRWLATHHPRLPVVLTSGYVLAPERLQGLHVQFVRKPFVIGALADAFVKALASVAAA